VKFAIRSRRPNTLVYGNGRESYLGKMALLFLEPEDKYVELKLCLTIH
jgi:hypothetical protein